MNADARQPLAGRTILVTRTKSQSPEFRRLLEDAGALVLELPTIEIRPRFSARLDASILSLESYDWLFFTSVNAVSIFLEQASRLRPDLKPGELEQPRICAIGPATARKIEDYGYSVALVPTVFQAEAVIDEFLTFHDNAIEGLRICLPRAARAREVLPNELRRKGAVVDLIPVYDTVLPESTGQTLSKLLRDTPIDLVTFTSSSTVHNFVQAAGPDVDLSRFSCAAIGPITAAAAREYGLNVAVLPIRWTAPDLASAIIDALSR